MTYPLSIAAVLLTLTLGATAMIPGGEHMQLQTTAVVAL